MALKYKLTLTSILLLAGATTSASVEAVSADATITIKTLTLICDAAQCKTPIYEVHADRPYGETNLELVFHPPSGTALDEPTKNATEIEGGGATHYVNALGAGPSWLKCKWYARSELGDNGLAKGYCYISIKK
jgi:hypothetical protein